MTTTDSLLTTADVARILRRQDKYVRQLVAAGTLAAIRLAPAGGLLFRREEIDRFLGERERAAAP